jgi:hypothetical protein
VLGGRMSGRRKFSHLVWVVGGMRMANEVDHHGVSPESTHSVHIRETGRREALGVGQPHHEGGGSLDLPARGSSAFASASGSARYRTAARPPATRFSPMQSTNQGLIVPLANKPVEFPM